MLRPAALFGAPLVPEPVAAEAAAAARAAAGGRGRDGETFHLVTTITDDKS